VKWLTFEIQQTPGFRLNLLDVGFLSLLIAGSVGLYDALPDRSLWGIPLYLGLSFFLFCNVFRIGDALEAIWYVPFTLIAAYSIYTTQLAWFWWLVGGFLEPLKWALIFYRLRSGAYR